LPTAEPQCQIAIPFHIPTFPQSLAGSSPKDEASQASVPLRPERYDVGKAIVLPPPRSLWVPLLSLSHFLYHCDIRKTLRYQLHTTMATNGETETHTQAQRYLSTRGTDEGVCLRGSSTSCLLCPYFSSNANRYLKLQPSLTRRYIVLLRRSRPQGPRLRRWSVHSRGNSPARVMAELEGPQLPRSGLRDSLPLHISLGDSPKRSQRYHQ
jgi:hypothetical protein